MAEADIRDRLMKTLYERLGTPGSWKGEGSSATFMIERAPISGSCTVEKILDYSLPDGTSLTHKSDVLLEYRRSGAEPSAWQYVSMEIKHTSAVTDQFKCRSFDMLHMKRAFGSRLHGMMLFVRVGQGIGLDRARAICYPFDEFVGVDLLQGDSLIHFWNDVLARVEAALNRS